MGNAERWRGLSLHTLSEFITQRLNQAARSWRGLWSFLDGWLAGSRWCLGRQDGVGAPEAEEFPQGVGSIQRIGDVHADGKGQGQG